MVVYSHSKIKTFEQCPLKYKYRYIDKIKIETKSIEALLGFAVHAVLENLYNQVKDNKVPSIEDIIKIYSGIWEENYNEKIVIVSEIKDQKFYFNLGLQFLIDYYLKHQPFGDNTLETEKKVIFEIEKGIWFIGYIDRLVHNLEKDEYEIHDYKTSNSAPSWEDIENDRQLALYSLAIKKIFKDKDICLIWHYLAHDKKICIRKTDAQLEELKKEFLDLIKKVELAKEFPAQPSRLCDWCEYKNICNGWKNN